MGMILIILMLWPGRSGSSILRMTRRMSGLLLGILKSDGFFVFASGGWWCQKNNKQTKTNPLEAKQQPPTTPGAAGKKTNQSLPLCQIHRQPSILAHPNLPFSDIPPVGIKLKPHSTRRRTIPNQSPPISHKSTETCTMWTRPTSAWLTQARLVARPSVSLRRLA